MCATMAAILALAAFLAGLVRPGCGAPPDAAAAQLVDLEKRLFDPSLSAAEVDRLLEDLRRPELAAAAAEQLFAHGQGRIDRIIAFAHDCPDIEARQLCADIVESLDGAYRTSEIGRQLSGLYREQTDSLLADRWARFRKDPLDARAVAMLMSAEPEKAYARLGKSSDRHDQLRYLLLRIRELSPDAFAAKHLAGHSGPGVMLAMRDVFSGAHREEEHRVIGVHRAVGHTYLRVLQLDPWEIVQLPTAQDDQVELKDLLPKYRYADFSQRWVHIFRVRDGQNCFRSLDDYLYQENKAQPKVGRNGFTWLNDGLCPLPQVASLPNVQLLAVYRGAPWWTKDYLPTVYRAQSFTEQGAGESAPAMAANQVAAATTAGAGNSASSSDPFELASPITPLGRRPAPQQAVSENQRRQSTAELLAGKALLKTDGAEDDVGILTAALTHFNAVHAADSTSEDAAYERFETLGKICSRARSRSPAVPVNDPAEQVLREGLAYFEQFGAHAVHGDEVHFACNVAAVAGLGNVIDRNLDVTPQRLRMAQMARRLLDDELDRQVFTQGNGLQSYTMEIVACAMKRTGIPVERREQWIDSILRRCTQAEREARKAKDLDQANNLHEEYDRMWLRAIELAVADGNLIRAKKLMEEQQARLDSMSKLPESDLVNKLRRLLMHLDDAPALAAYDRWWRNLQTQTVTPIGLQWPTVEVFPTPAAGSAGSPEFHPRHFLYRTAQAIGNLLHSPRPR